MVCAFLLMESLVGLQALLAYRDNILTVSQMQAAGIGRGLPFVWHFGMWGDLGLVSPLISYLIGRYLERWRPWSMLLSLAIGFGAAGLLSWTYTFSDMPEAHVKNHMLTAAGVVHVLYMAAALSVFVQFFFFTPALSRRQIGTVSVLLFIHVLFGTHMALGLINAAVTLDWYPGRPLQSVPGWTIAGILALGLVVSNLAPAVQLAGAGFGSNGIVKLILELNVKRRILSRLINAYTWSTAKEDPRKIEGFLQLLDDIYIRVGGIAVVAIVWNKVRAYRSSSDHTLTEAGLHLVLPCLLAVLLGVVYWLSRKSVRDEMKIGRKLFPQGRVPDQWGGPRTRAGIALSVAAFLGLYLFIAYVVDNIILTSIIMFAIACIDFNTRRLIGKGISEVFSDPKYAPRSDDKDRWAIAERRSVARWYLFALPHRLKEGGRVAGCGVAFGLAVLGYLYSKEWLMALAYLALIGTLAANEVINELWRRERSRQLDDIDEKSKAGGLS